MTNASSFQASYRPEGPLCPASISVFNSTSVPGDRSRILATHFAAKYAPPGERPKKIAPGVMEIFLNYPWPGNVRQLENVMERVCVISQSDEILVEHLPSELTEPRQK